MNKFASLALVANLAFVGLSVANSAYADDSEVSITVVNRASGDIVSIKMAGLGIGDGETMGPNLHHKPLEPGYKTTINPIINSDDCTENLQVKFDGDDDVHTLAEFDACHTSQVIFTDLAVYVVDLHGDKEKYEY